MTKRHFEVAAKQVKAILDGHWTSEFPSWADRHGNIVGPIEIDTEDSGNLDVSYTRAVWTAEAYILLFTEFNPRFDQTRFLKACGLS
jgi:hypothetical protein